MRIISNCKWITSFKIGFLFLVPTMANLPHGWYLHTAYPQLNFVQLCFRGHKENTFLYIEILSQSHKGEYIFVINVTLCMEFIVWTFCRTNAYIYIQNMKQVEEYMSQRLITPWLGLVIMCSKAERLDHNNLFYHCSTTVQHSPVWLSMTSSHLNFSCLIILELIRWEHVLHIRINK